MKKWVIFTLFFLLSLGLLKAKVDVDLFGYFEPQFMGLYVDNDFFHLISNKLRVDLKSELSKNITFAANFNCLTYHGLTDLNILDFLPDSVAGEVPEGMEMFYVLPFSDQYYLDNAYIKFAFKHFDLMVGKQQISLGTGYVWNPTDVFNVKDYLDPTYEQPGHNALRLDIPLGQSYTFTALYVPEESWKESAKLLQLKGKIWRFDYAITVIEKRWIFHDYNQFDVNKMNFLELEEKRQLLGFSTAGELLGVGIWLEYAYNWMETSDDFYEMVVGVDYTFNFQTYIMIEYYRNTLGRMDAEEYTLNDWMRLMAQEQKSIARDQVYILAQHPVSDLINLGLSSIYCINDGSLAFIPMLNYSLSDNV
ncbi:MAG: hypothetical protein WBB64_08230, partial [Anaerolineales bacterium]